MESKKTVKFSLEVAPTVSKVYTADIIFVHNNPKQLDITRIITWERTSPFVSFNLVSSDIYEREKGQDIWNITIFNQETDFTIEINNNGTDDLQFTGCTTDSDWLTIPPKCSNLKTQKNKQQLLIFSLTPQEIKEKQITVTINHNAEVGHPQKKLIFNMNIQALPDVSLITGSQSGLIEFHMREDSSEKNHVITLLNNVTGNPSKITKVEKVTTDEGYTNLVQIKDWPLNDDFELKPGKNHSLTMTFQPPKDKPNGYQGSFQVTLGESGEQTNLIYYKVIATEPKMIVTPPKISLVFPYTEIGNEKTETFVIRNDGNLELTVSNIELDQGHSWLQLQELPGDGEIISMDREKIFSIQISMINSVIKHSKGITETENIMITHDAIYKNIDKIPVEVKIQVGFLELDLSQTNNTDYMQFSEPEIEVFKVRLTNAGTLAVNITQMPTINNYDCTNFDQQRCPDPVNQIEWLTINAFVLPQTIEPESYVDLSLTRNLLALPVGSHAKRITIKASVPTNQYQFITSVIVKARCPSNCDSPTKGTCERDANNPTQGICNCLDQYIGDACQHDCLMQDGKVCNDQGRCVLTDSNVSCSCTNTSQYGGKKCQTECGCSINGVCSVDGKCSCTPGYMGELCQLYCPGGGNCNNHGNCTLINGGANVKCECEDDHKGKSCKHVCPRSEINREVCHGRGVCKETVDNSTAECVCNSNWNGTACSKTCRQGKGCNEEYGKCNWQTEKCICGEGMVAPHLGCIPCEKECIQGTCIWDTSKNGTVCKCDNGFVGSLCQHQCPNCNYPKGNSTCKEGTDPRLRATCACREEKDGNDVNASFLYYGPTEQPCKYAFPIGENGKVCSGIPSSTNDLMGRRFEDSQVKCICEYAEDEYGTKSSSFRQTGEACELICPIGHAGAKSKDLVCSGHGVCEKRNISGWVAFCECDPYWTGKKCDTKSTEIPPGAALSIDFVWGVKNGDTSSMNKNDPEDRPIPIWDNTFNLADTEAQEWMSNMCDDLFSMEEVRQEYSKCIMYDFKNYVQNLINSSSVVMDYCSLFTCWPLPEKFFMAAFLSWDQLGRKYKFDVGINSDASRVTWVRISVKTNIAQNQGGAALQPTYDFWEEWLEKQIKNKPESIGKVTQRSEVWARMVVEQEFINSISSSLATSVFTAALSMLVFTGNFYLMLISVFLMIGTITSMVGFMVLQGWSIGAIEAISLNIIVGLSVDYSLHLGHSYQHARSQKRFYRVQTAVSEIGFSILSSACTTIGSMLILLFCTIVVFVVIGTIVSVTVLVSITFSLMGFASILSIVGPEKNNGNISNLCACLRTRELKRENTLRRIKTQHGLLHVDQNNVNDQSKFVDNSSPASTTNDLGVELSEESSSSDSDSDEQG